MNPLRIVPFLPAAIEMADPERFAQQALGHNSKAVHHAYAKYAEVPVPSLDDWEKDWREHPQQRAATNLTAVDYRWLLATATSAN